MKTITKHKTSLVRKVQKANIYIKPYKGSYDRVHPMGTKIGSTQLSR